MRHIATICAHQVRRVIFDPGRIAWLIAVPLALIGVLGSSLQFFMSNDFTPARPYRVAVAEHESDVAAVVVQSLHGLPQYFDVVGTVTPDAAREMVARREADAAVVFSAADEPTLAVVAAPDAIVSEMLMTIVREVLLHRQAQRAETVRTVYTEVEAARRPTDELPEWLHTDSFSYYTVGVMAMFVLFAAHAVGANAARERATDAYARIRALGVNPAEYMVGSSVASMTVSVLFIAAMAVVSHVLFDAKWGRLVPWMTLTLLAAAAAAGLSLVLTAMAPRPENIEGVGSTIFNVMAFLGGSMMPLHVLPEWVRTSLEWLPTRAVLSGYLKVSQGADLASISPELTTLGAAAAALLGVGWLAWSVHAKGEAR